MPQKEAIKALVGVAAPLLTIGTVSTGGDDSGELAARIDMASPFAPRKWIQTPPFVQELQKFGASNPNRFGGTSVFEIPKLATAIEDATLVLDFPPLQGSAGSTITYVDHLGFAVIKTFKLKYGSNSNWEIQKWSLYRQYAMTLSNEKRLSLNPIILGDATTAQRTAFATNGGRLYVPLFAPFSLDTTMVFPLVCVSQKLRFEFQFEPLVNVIQHNSTVPVTSVGNLEAELWLNVVHTSGTEANIFFTKSLRAQGIAYMVHEPILQNGDSFATTVNNVEMKVKIAQITRPLQIIYWYLIPDNLINDTGTNDYFMFNPNPPVPIPAGMAAYNPPISWWIDANGLRIQEPIDVEYSRWYIHYKYHTSQAGEYIIFQTYSINPEAINTALGYIDYGNLSNPAIHVNFGAGGTGTFGGNPQSVRLMIEGLDYNFWYLQGGDFSISFT